MIGVRMVLNIKGQSIDVITKREERFGKIGGCGIEIKREKLCGSEMSIGKRSSVEIGF
jgi:hypothetical protein